MVPCPLCGLDELLVHQYKSWLDRFYIYESAKKVPDCGLVFHIGYLGLTSLLFQIIENDILGMVVQEQAARHILF